MDLKTLKDKPVHVTTAVALVTAMSTGGYQLYSVSNEILSSYATKSDIVELKYFATNIRRELSLDLLDTVIMSYEDKLMIIDFEITNNQSTPSSLPTKKNLERRLADFEKQRQILRLEISNSLQNNE